MNQLSEIFRQLLAMLVSSPCVACGPPASTVRDELLWANTGGPRSRVVSTPIVSRLLSKGSGTLGLQPLGHYEMQPRYGEGGFRKMAARLLRMAGFSSPEQAWEALRDQLPDQPALAVDAPRPQAPDIAHEYENESLIAALVLGKCCGPLFSPARPIIWSERRLARSLRLVHCDSETFTREDDD
jgi:hypothetical protein